MKALKNWFSRRGALPLTAYLLALAVWLVLGAVHFGSDAAARAQGRLAEETMAVTDWQLVGLVQGADGTHSPAKEAGVQEGDVLCKAGETALHSNDDLQKQVALSAGQPIKLTLER